MFPSPSGNETSADVYRRLSILHDQLENFENNRIGGIEDHLRGMAQRLRQVDEKLTRIENRLQQIT